MTTVHVFDPAMCCSTGVCGPSVDPQLVRFAADLDWLKSQGTAVERYNLMQQPAAFAGDAEVKATLESKGEDGLPLVKVDGRVMSSGLYPSRDELAAWAGLRPPTPSIFTDAVSELVAMGAAIASNCEPCFKFHYDKARKLGVSKEDMMCAVNVAQGVKDAPARAVSELAHRYLKGEAAEPTAEAESCCGPADESSSEKATRCC